jgi:aminoglycoside N3'-acetyltransferase
VQDGQRVWVEKPDMAADNGVHFPVVGKRFIEEGHVQSGKVGHAESMLFSTKTLVDFATAYFRESLE